MKITVLFFLVFVSFTAYSKGKHEWMFLRGYALFLNEKGEKHSHRSQLAANLGTSQNYHDINFNAFKVLNSKNSRKLNFLKVSKNCEKFTFELIPSGDEEERLVCISMAVFKEKGKASQSLFINAPKKIENIIQHDLRKERVLDKSEKLTIIKTVFHSPKVKPKIETDMTYLPVFEEDKLTGLKGYHIVPLGQFVEDAQVSKMNNEWVRISYLGGDTYAKKGKHIVSNLDEGTFEPFISFSHDGKRYHVFKASWYPMGQLRMFEETKDGEFLEVENSFKVVPAVYPKH